MVLKGFKFGMLLQFAIGPMCLMVFNTASTYGLITSMLLVLAIVMIDALYVTLAGVGIASIINKSNIKRGLKIFGCIVLVLFGLDTIAGALNYPLFPSISLLSNIGEKNIFIQGLILTTSNPLTIIFWSGVFSTQIIENKLNKKQILFFGIGCVLSTLIFLSAVAILGTIVNGFLPHTIINILNIAVGALLILFGVKLLFK